MPKSNSTTRLRWPHVYRPFRFLFSAAITFAGLMLILWQLRDGQRQRESSSSQVEIYDINRELLSLGFPHPQLFEVLNGNGADPMWERRYLQFWQI